VEGQLAGKVAVVTGAGSGMGRATALAFAREGARVVAVDVDAAGAEAVAAEIVAGGGQALSVGADVRRAAEVRAAVGRALAGFGTVDVLACIAGVLRRSKIEEIDEDEWDLVLDVNLKGVFLCCQAVLPTMKRRRRSGSTSTRSTRA
jgi:3-oxoacyl-[acyl-carrier protein] reductase